MPYPMYNPVPVAVIYTRYDLLEESSRVVLGQLWQGMNGVSEERRIVAVTSTAAIGGEKRALVPCRETRYSQKARRLTRTP
jgi:hypothetical protein